MSLVEIHSLTKDYGRGRGVFDIDLQVEEGETFGFVGTNGAGKTTTIRHLMGFLHSDKGSCTIKGLDCWTQSEQVKHLVGYVPGEISFPDEPTGSLDERSAGELALHVEDRGASYPIRIDPTFSDANWVSLGGIGGADDDILAVACTYEIPRFEDAAKMVQKASRLEIRDIAELLIQSANEQKG